MLLPIYTVVDRMKLSSYLLFIFPPYCWSIFYCSIISRVLKALKPRCATWEANKWNLFIAISLAHLTLCTLRTSLRNSMTDQGTQDTRRVNSVTIWEKTCYILLNKGTNFLFHSFKRGRKRTKEISLFIFRESIMFKLLLLKKKLH